MKSKEQGTEEKQPSNGRVEELLAQLGDVVGNIAKTQQEQNERLAELERSQDGRGKADLLVAGLAYSPDRQHLPEMSIIPISAVEPFALSYVCGAIGSPEVRQGKVSLGDINAEIILRLFRGVKGRTLDLAAQHARETEVTKHEGFGGEAVDLGKGF